MTKRRPIPSTPPARQAAGACLLIAVLGLLVYANHLRNPFQFDSIPYIRYNPELQRPQEMLQWSYWTEGYFSRALMQMSLAVNAVLDELRPFGYHLVNLGFHLVNAMLVYFVTRRAAARLAPAHRSWTPRQAQFIALLAALIFLVHPIQTEAVVYIMSRSEVLAGTFYLAAFYWFQTVVDAPRGRRVGVRLAAAVGIPALFIVGFSVKQTVATLPALLGLYYVCGCEPQSRLLRFLRKWKWVLGGCALLGLAALLGKLLTDESFLVGPSKPEEMVGRRNYMLSQPPVIVFYYLKTLLWPVNLNIDPDIPVITSAWNPLFLAAGLLLGAGVALAARAKHTPLYFFFTAWFLVVLSPSSSIVTLHDLAAEHRVYLAGTGFFVLFAALLVRGARRVAVSDRTGQMVATRAAAVLLVAALSLLTMHRNSIWTSDLALWRDTVNKSPHLVRPLINLARAYSLRGEVDRSIELYERSLEMDDGLFVPHYNLAELYLKKGRVDDAIARFERALAIDPEVSEVHAKLGEVYLNLKKFERAERYLRRAVELNTRDAVSLRNLGIVTYFYLNKPDEGIAFFKRSLALDPDQPEADRLRQLLEAHRKHRGREKKMKEIRASPGAPKYSREL